jgi:hypothetical protein
MAMRGTLEMKSKGFLGDVWTFHVCEFNALDSMLTVKQPDNPESNLWQREVVTIRYTQLQYLSSSSLVLKKSFVCFHFAL